MTERILPEDLADGILDLLAHYIAFPTMLFDDTSVIFLNEACSQLLGRSSNGCDTALATAIMEAFRASGLASSAHGNQMRDNSYLSGEIEIEGMSGEPICIEYRARPVRYASRPALMAQLVDISDKKAAERNLSRVSRLRAIMLDVAQAILRVEGLEEMCQLVLKNALDAIDGASLGTIMIKEGDRLRVASSIGFGPEVASFSLPAANTFLHIVTEGKMDQVVNIPDLGLIGKYHAVKTNFGEGVFIKSTLTGPIYVGGDLFGIISVDAIEVGAFDEDDVKSMKFLRDNIEIAVSNHFLYKEKAFLAKYDRLTGLYNRWFFEEQFSLTVEKALRYNESFNLVIFDVDGLKAINDSYGHLVGDRVLEELAKEMRLEMRKSDIVARFGGDEFVGIFFNSDGEALTRKFDDMMVRMRHNPLPTEQGILYCSASYGIASFPEDGTTLDKLLRVADEKMYTKKRNAVASRPV